MSEIKQTTSETPTPTSKQPTESAWTELDKKFTAVETYLASLAGKPGQNPFIWANKNKFNEVKAQLEARDIACIKVIEAWPLEPGCSVKSAGPRQIVTEPTQVIRARQELKIPVARR